MSTIQSCLCAIRNRFFLRLWIASEAYAAGCSRTRGCLVGGSMRRTWLWLVVVGVGVSLHSPQADAKRSAPVDQGYQAATVVSVSRHESYSNYAGDNPSDAPLQARDYAYDIGIR